MPDSGTREDIARRRLGELYPLLIGAFTRDRAREDQTLEAISKVACAILSSGSSTNLLATARGPLAYLRRCVANALRHRPPQKEIVLLHGEAISNDGTTARGAAPSCRSAGPPGQSARNEVSVVVARLVHYLPQPKRAVMVLWMRGYTGPEVERTLGMPQTTVRYHVSTGLAKLRDLLGRFPGRLALTDFVSADCIPRSA
jgi:DNA-directed RNA polymerase specialized sigma24 family protein